MYKKGLSSYPFAIVVWAVASCFITIYLIVFSFAGKIDSVKPCEVSGALNKAVSSDPERMCAFEKKNFVFLAAGEDAISGLTDVILLINFDTKQNKVCVVQIPRDTYLSYTKGSYRKINGASHRLGGLRGLADMIEQTWMIDIDYTFEFTLEVFSRLVDMIGGVPVNIPHDMNYDDPSQNLYIHLKSGDNVLYGNEAVQFVRFRSAYVQGDIGRTDAQKIFLSAFADKITNGISPMKIPAIVSALIGDVVTDMSLGTCISFARAAMNVDISNITLMTVAGSDARTGGNSGAWYYIINRNAVVDIINNHFKSVGNQIDTESFDKSHLFSNAAYPHFEKIYYSNAYSVNEYCAEDVNNNGLEINMTD